MSSQDQNIHPVATARAAETVAQHAKPQELVFYAGWFCPFVQRAWITLEEKGIPYQYKEVNPYKKEKHFLEINPKGLVPAIEYKGKALYESLILCEFLEENYPSHSPHLLPSDPSERAYARIWLDFIGKNVIPGNMRLIQAQEPEKQEALLAEYVKSLKTFAEQIKGPYFLSDQFSLVDVAIAPWIVRDYIPADYRGFSRALVGTKWQEYASRIENRESVLKTISGKEYYAPIYDRYLRDVAQSEGAKAIREGRAIP